MQAFDLAHETACSSPVPCEAGTDCGAWLAERQVVLVGADNPGVEAFPSGDPSCQVPMHLELIRGHGVLFSELLDLEPLAAAGRATFLFVVAPLPLVGGVGSPVVPVAIL